MVVWSRYLKMGIKTMDIQSIVLFRVDWELEMNFLSLDQKMDDLFSMMFTRERFWIQLIVKVCRLGCVCFGISCWQLVCMIMRFVFTKIENKKLINAIPQP